MGAPPHRRRRRITIAVAAAALAVAAATGSRVALARWHDEEPLATGQLRSATVALTADGTVAATLAPLAITPTVGAPVTAHRAVTIGNAGDVALRYRLERTTATSSPADLVTVGMTWRVAVVASVPACTGTAPGAALALTTGTAIVGAAFTTPRALAPGAAEVLCLSFTVPSTLTATFREGAATPTLTFVGQAP